MFSRYGRRQVQIIGKCVGTHFKAKTVRTIGNIFTQVRMPVDHLLHL